MSQKRQQLLSARDRVLSSVPQQNAERWLSHHAAILDITLEPLPVTKGGSSAISLAIQELWDVSELAVLKSVGSMKKNLKYVFSSLSVGLTLISMNSGFYFYLKLLDLRTAILAILVFEVLRLSTLYAMVVWTVQKKLLAAPLYFLVASVCAFAATSSFHATIIERHNIESSPYRSEVEKGVNLIKKTYASKFGNGSSVISKIAAWWLNHPSAFCCGTDDRTLSRAESSC